jgi:hypothetical protein
MIPLYSSVCVCVRVCACVRVCQLIYSHTVCSLAMVHWGPAFKCNTQPFVLWTLSQRFSDAYLKYEIKTLAMQEPLVVSAGPVKVATFDAIIASGRTCIERLYVNDLLRKGGL